MHSISHHLLEWHLFETWAFFQDIKIMSQKLFMPSRRATKFWQARQQNGARKTIANNNPCKNDAQQLLGENLRAI